MIKSGRCTKHLRTQCALNILHLSILGVFVQDRESFVDLSVHCIRGFQQVQELHVVHLEQHTSDLAGQIGVRAMIGRYISASGTHRRGMNLLRNAHVDNLTKHLLLFHRGRT